MRQQGQYSDSGLGAYSVSQMHHVPSQMVEQSHPDPFEGRLEAFTPEREHSYVASKNEDQWRWERDESKMPNSMTSHMFNEGQGQGGDATRSYFQSQRPNPKLGLEKGSNSDPRSQSHGKNMESRFGDGPLPQNFDGLEQKFIDDIIKLTKEQNDAEDEENARHRERILAINAQYEEQLAALRVRHAGRRDELLRRESTARQHQYQKGIMDHYPNGGIGPGDPRGNSGVTNLAASGQAHQNYESEHFDSFRERARFLGNSARDPNLDPRGSYPGGRVYDTVSRLCSNGNITWHVVVYIFLCLGQILTRWWKDAQDSLTGDADGKRGLPFLASPGSSYAGPLKIINSIFSSDLVFNLRREEDSSQNSENGEVGISGRDYALVSGEMWVEALKWHSDSKSSTRNGGSFSVAEDNIADVYPLQLRLSIQREANLLGVRISKKDNVVELFRRACKLFNVESELLRIWDFSGHTISLFSISNKQRQSDQEVLLELQVYGLSDFIKCKEGKKDELANSILGNSSANSLVMNGASGTGGASCFRVNSSVFSGSSREAGSLGLTGLQNLGNTCFMNSALQCLVHTPKLVDYFLGDYGREINHDNPLGMNGEIALAFGDMLRKLWAPGASPVAPRTFKSKLARFAPQFSGCNQHDSQELLAFLLDGLHEDLNRVKKKPYVEAKDGDGRSDNEVADEYWQNHLARNDSIIVDVCQGQYKSTLVCPICKKVSTTFDPFMYLSLPLPSTTMRTMTLTVVSTGGSTPAPYTVTVPKSGKWEDLIKALSTACSLKADETLLVAEVYNNRIIRYLEEPADSLSLIRDGDRLVAYRLAKDEEQIPLAVFMHQRVEEQYINGKRTTSLKAFGFPLVAKLPGGFNGSDIKDIYKKLLRPFQVSAQDALEENHTSDVDATEKTKEVENVTSSTSACVIDPLTIEDGVNCNSPSDADLQFYTTDDKGIIRGSEIQVGEFVVGSEKSKRLYVLVSWPQKQIERYETHLLTSLPEVFKSSFFAKRPQESVSLYKCLEAFLQEEPLGPEDMWYCPSCKKHCQASKKLDLWRLPEILVIHLKRFSYSRFMKNKLEAYVDFPVDDLDLSMYIAYKNGQSCTRYVLYAVSNHYGSMGGGHYTAFVHQGGDQWYNFDDSNVYPIGLDKIKSSAAYVLFYRRVVV